jgi:hypothetical protein
MPSANDKRWCWQPAAWFAPSLVRLETQWYKSQIWTSLYGWNAYERSVSHVGLPEKLYVHLAWDIMLMAVSTIIATPTSRLRTKQHSYQLSELPQAEQIHGSNLWNMRFPYTFSVTSGTRTEPQISYHPLPSLNSSVSYGINNRTMLDRTPSGAESFLSTTVFSAADTHTHTHTLSLSLSPTWCVQRTLSLFREREEKSGRRVKLVTKLQAAIRLHNVVHRLFPHHLWRCRSTTFQYSIH